MTTIQVPFMGFYYSIFSAGLDSAEEQAVGNIHENDDLDPCKVTDLFWRYANYMAGYRFIAEKYVGYLNDFIQDELEIDLGLKFETMISPKEYNFTTDRIFAYYDPAALQKLLDGTSQGTLAETIKANHTSRSGFISFYSNDIEEWLAKPLETWDHNEVCTLIEAALSEFEDWEMSVFEVMSDQNVFDTAFNQCVDWPAFEAALAELKEESHDPV
jgi:hypothetical protein